MFLGKMDHSDSSSIVPEVEVYDQDSGVWEVASTVPNDFLVSYIKAKKMSPRLAF